jgi:prepilin-type N-terminal cleavage/methylation domain-containing protein
MKVSTRKRPGFSLIEMLCVFVLIAVLGLVLSLIIQETIKVERLQAQGFEQMVQFNTLADQFRADVAQAEQAPQDWEQYRSGPGTLILQMKDGKHVVYVWQGKKLQRNDFDAREESGRVLPVDSKRTDVEFVRADPKSNLVRLRLLAMRDGNPVPGETLEIAAALGGDWR